MYDAGVLAHPLPWYLFLPTATFAGIASLLTVTLCLTSRGKGGKGLGKGGAKRHRKVLRDNIQVRACLANTSQCDRPYFSNLHGTDSAALLPVHIAEVCAAIRQRVCVLHTAAAQQCMRVSLQADSYARATR